MIDTAAGCAWVMRSNRSSNKITQKITDIAICDEHREHDEYTNPMKSDIEDTPNVHFD